MGEVLIWHFAVCTLPNILVKRKVENTFLYTAVAVAIVAVGGITYFVMKEFFGPDSPQTIVRTGLKLVRQDDRVIDLFGPTIAAYGEETSRGRRRHYAHHRYEKDGQERVRVVSSFTVEPRYKPPFWNWRISNPQENMAYIEISL